MRDSSGLECVIDWEKEEEAKSILLPCFLATSEPRVFDIKRSESIGCEGHVFFSSFRLVISSRRVLFYLATRSYDPTPKMLIRALQKGLF